MVEIDNLKTKVFNGLIWRFLERILAQGVSFVVSIVLARLLSPDDYGTIAMINIFIVIGNVFVDGGFNNALVQKMDSDELDFSTVFHASFIISIIVYISFFLVAPFIADFYGMQILCPALRVLAIQVVIASFKSIQVAYVQKTMQFKMFFFATLGGTVFSGILGIFLAYRGFGIWALVIQYLSNSMIDTTVLFVLVKWKPKLIFSIKRLKGLFGFGWKILVWSLAMQIFDNIRSLVIGKKYSSADLAFYNRGRSWPNLIISNINSTISSVLFPTMSNVQNDKGRLKNVLRRSCCTSMYLISPFMVGMMALGKEIIVVLLTEKWLPAFPYMEISCIYLIFVPLQTAELESIKSVGKSELLLKMDFFVKITQIIVLLITMNIGVLAIAIGSIVTTFVACTIYGYFAKKVVGYSFSEQITDIISSIMPAAVVGTVVFLYAKALSYCFGNVTILISGTIVGVVLFLALSKSFRNESYLYLSSYLTERIMLRRK